LDLDPNPFPTHSSHTAPAHNGQNPGVVQRPTCNEGYRFNEFFEVMGMTPLRHTRLPPVCAPTHAVQ
jgi:hypothetical protein